MKKIAMILATAASLLGTERLIAHCQMPCGIYHDEMVYEEIDQYVETMYKGMTVLGENKFSTSHERNEIIRWIYQKEKQSNKAADLIVSYFLQQKIKPGEKDTPQRVISAHRLLFLIVCIKQNTDRQMVKDFSEEWEKFKLFFHREGYECEMEKKRLAKDAEKRKESSSSAKDHDHTHDDHTHDHDDHTH